MQIKQIAMAAAAAMSMTMPPLQAIAQTANGNLSTVEQQRLHANAIASSDCQGYRPIARGIFMKKASGETRPKANNDIEEQIIEGIYGGAWGAATPEMAEAAGEQICYVLVSLRQLNPYGCPGIPVC